jgi:osmotically-inducible protein OsmY
MRRLNGVFQAVVIVLLAGSLGACSTAPRRTEAERAADADTAAWVETALTADPHLFARHIDVSVDGGVVYLGGYVWSVEDLYLARNLAASVPGVKSVSSEMELMRGGGKGR